MSGGFADAHEAKLDGEKRVCIKVFRLYLQGSGDATKKVRSFCFFFAVVPTNRYWNAK